MVSSLPKGLFPNQIMIYQMYIHFIKKITDLDVKGYVTGNQFTPITCELYTNSGVKF